MELHFFLNAVLLFLNFIKKLCFYDLEDVNKPSIHKSRQIL